MSTDTSDGGRTHREATDGRYAVLSVSDAATVIYDRSNHRAWVQSDRTVSLDEMS